MIAERGEIQELVCLLEVDFHVNDVLVDEWRSLVHIQIELCCFSFTYVVREYEVTTLCKFTDDPFSSFSILCDDEAIVEITALIYDSAGLFIEMGWNLEYR